MKRLATGPLGQAVGAHGAAVGHRDRVEGEVELGRDLLVRIALAEESHGLRLAPRQQVGRLDHLALEAASIDAFETARDRLVARGASDGFVTDFGPVLSLFFRDPDGLEAEVCVTNPDAQPGVHHPPGTPARRYHGDGAPPA